MNPPDTAQAAQATIAKPAEKSTAAKKAVPKKPVPVKAETPAAVRPKTRPAVAVSAPEVKEGPKRAKLVRDSFTMPQSDFALIDLLKTRALGFKRPTKKSELLRAGLQALAAMPEAHLKAALGKLAPLKTGRPKKAG